MPSETGLLSAADTTHPIYEATELKEIRGYFRRGEWTKNTKGIGQSFVHTGLVVVPQEAAFEFLLFCQRNPKPSPVLDVTDPGDPVTRTMAPTADLRTDLPLYRVYRKDEPVIEVTDITSYWRDDMVGILVGCSHGFSRAMKANDVSLTRGRSLRADSATVFQSNIDCRPAGRFAGPLAVTVAQLPPAEAIRATQVSTRYPLAHGAPIHVGDPAALGIDMTKPDIGDIPLTIVPDTIPVVWACAATVFEVVRRAQLEIAITHAPAGMFITDTRHETLAVL